MPQRLGMALGPDYSVLAELGRGGFAVVYAVRDLKLNRYLAVKVMRPEIFGAPTAAERFRREAKVVAQLDHPNILPIIFAGEGAGLAYFVMPRVHGDTLHRHLEREAPLRIGECIRIFKELASGLAYAHDQGVVHRDVKPANIMLDQHGRVLLLDFGVAKSLSADGGSLSFTGAVIGTPEYMSPEQASGSRALDHRSDIYSLGVIAFEMLTGTLPFTGRSVQEILSKQASAVAPNVREFRSETPPAFGAAVTRCLERDADRRWANAADAVRFVG